MKRLLALGMLLIGTASACTRPVYVYNAPPRHDNGLHTGWYKPGKVKGLPPGQAKKRSRY